MPLCAAMSLLDQIAFGVTGLALLAVAGAGVWVVLAVWPRLLSLLGH